MLMMTLKAHLIMLMKEFTVQIGKQAKSYIKIVVSMVELVYFQCLVGSFRPYCRVHP